MADTSASALLSGRRLLVVEDDFILAEDIQGELTGAGVEVIGPVPTVGSALKILGSEPALDGAVLDVNLGGEKVFPLVDALRSWGIPLHAMTTPGGGCQGRVIIGSGTLLHFLGEGYRSWRRVMKSELLEAVRAAVPRSMPSAASPQRWLAHPSSPTPCRSALTRT